MRLAAPLLLVGSLFACSSSPPAATTSDGVSMNAPPPGWTPSPDPAPPPPPTAEAPPAPADLAGTWASTSCGTRTYERIVELRPDGTFTGTDRVSPCPPGARCVWSGIITREGTWKHSGDVVELTVTTDGKGPAGQPFPPSLRVDAGALVETGGSEPCPYTRR